MSPFHSGSSSVFASSLTFFLEDIPQHGEGDQIAPAAVELRGVPFGREVSTEKNVDGDKLYDFIAHNLLPQCNISPDCYELKEESRCLVLMRTHGRTIKFFMTTEYIPIDEECSTYFNNLQVSFKLEPDEYGQFLDMINRG